MVGKERRKKKIRTRRKEEEKKEINHSRLIYSYLEYWQYWNKIILINSARHLICIQFVFPWELGLGLG